MREGIHSYNYLTDYLDTVRAKGRYAFTVEELKEQFDISDKALHQNLFRLITKKKIVQIRKGFYTILPAEYARQGVIPAILFIDDMMRSLGKRYYIGLISAAAMHGAAHQQTMETFIITEKPALRNINNKKIKIKFFVKGDWNSNDIEQIKTDAGYVQVSSPELTALDLLNYVNNLGMNRVMTILRELIEVIKPANLNKIAKKYKQMATIQRLGYLLENELGNEKLSQVLYKLVADKNGVNIPLMPGKDKTGVIDTKWRIIHNVKIESDL